MISIIHSKNMENLYSFLKKKLKENNIKIGTFIEMTHMSKSTIYRVMKGYQKPSEELLKITNEILNLNSEDQRKLNYYISMIDMDESSIEASNAVKNFLFEPKNMDTKDIEFIYYKDNEKYMKTFEDIMNSINSSLSGKSAKVNLHIVNSTSENIMNNIFKHIQNFQRNINIKEIEHLVGLTKNQPVKSIKILQNFIPMLEFNNYKVLYTDSLPNSDSTMFNNFILITYFYIEDGKEKFGYHAISFLEDSIGTCYVGSSKDSIYDMFFRNYSYIKDIYTPAICNSSTSDFKGLMNDIEFEDGRDENTEIYLFKRTPCYKRIPPQIFTNLKNKLVDNNLAIDFVKSINQLNFIGEQEAYLALDEIEAEMIKRYNKAKSVYTVDILSKNGLMKFVETGRLSDHFDGMPSFSKEEVVIILSDMKRRHLDPKEPYKFHIVGNTSKTRFVLTVFKEKGFLIEHANEDKKCEFLNYCIIEDLDMCNILYEFAKEYVPTRLAMPDKDAVEYIDTLIEIAKR